jgi:hypothetical protein
MAYNFGGKQQSQQLTKQPSKIKGKGSGVTIDKPVYQPPKPQPEPSQPQKQPTNTNIEGNVSFNKTIYSRTQFDRLVSNGFEELTQKQDDFNTDQLFDQYNRLFFDIPKEGTNSHRTLVENSSEYLSGFADPRDEEIARLNETVADLQVQLATANSDVNVVREHPFFKNGSVLNGSALGAPWNNKYYMDKGFKRMITSDSVVKAIARNLGAVDTTSTEMDKVFTTIEDYKLILDIPSGPDLNEANFGEEFIPPSQEVQDAEQFIINLDPEDAALDPSRVVDVYGNDFGAYKIALEKDYTEKTSAIDTIETRLANQNYNSEEERQVLETGLANLISRRGQVEQMLANFDNIITGAIVTNVLPTDFAANLNFNEPGFDVKYNVDALKAKVRILYGTINPISTSVSSFVTYINNISYVKQIREQDPNLGANELYHALWVKYIQEASGTGPSTTTRAAALQTANSVYSDLT